MKRSLKGLAAFALLACLCACQSNQDPGSFEEEWKDTPTAAAPAAEEGEEVLVQNAEDETPDPAPNRLAKARLREREESYRLPLKVAEPIEAKEKQEEKEDAEDREEPDTLYLYPKPSLPKGPIPRAEESGFMI